MTNKTKIVVIIVTGLVILESIIFIMSSYQTIQKLNDFWEGNIVFITILSLLVWLIYIMYTAIYWENKKK